MYSYTISETTTFTQTHAKHMAAKFAADLKRMQRFYDQPSDMAIANYEEEVIDGLSLRVRCLLHCTLYFLPYTRNA